MQVHADIHRISENICAFVFSHFLRFLSLHNFQKLLFIFFIEFCFYFSRARRLSLIGVVSNTRFFIFLGYFEFWQVLLYEPQFFIEEKFTLYNLSWEFYFEINRQHFHNERIFWCLSPSGTGFSRDSNTERPFIGPSTKHKIVQPFCGRIRVLYLPWRKFFYNWHYVFRGFPSVNGFLFDRNI